MLTHADPCAVYWLYDIDGRLLYVGMTQFLKKRMTVHHSQSPWFDQVASSRAVWYPNRKAASDAEMESVNTDEPLYNTRTKAADSGLQYRARRNARTILLNDAELAMIEAAADMAGERLTHYIRDAAIAKAKRAK